MLYVNRCIGHVQFIVWTLNITIAFRLRVCTLPALYWTSAELSRTLCNWHFVAQGILGREYLLLVLVECKSAFATDEHLNVDRCTCFVYHPRAKTSWLFCHSVKLYMIQYYSLHHWFTTRGPPDFIIRPAAAFVNCVIYYKTYTKFWRLGEPLVARESAHNNRRGRMP